MNTLLYILVIAAAMMLLSRNLPGFHVDGWMPAIFGTLILAVVHAIVKPVLFVSTLPLTFVTFGLFLLVLNALMLGLTALIVPGFRIDGFVPMFLASLILSLVGIVWKAITKEGKKKDS